MGTLLQDIRYGGRMLRKAPGFTAIALVTLAIGIGANTIMFSIVNVLLFRPPQVDAPERLVGCDVRNVRGYFRYSAYVDIRENNSAFSSLAACDTNFEILTLVRGDAVRRAYGKFVSGNYFSVLGVAPAVGRTFRPEEERFGADPGVVLSHRTWQQFGGDPDIVGTHMTVNGALFRIIGVAPRGFTGTTLIGPDLWLPLGSYGQVAHVGREKPERLPSEIWNYVGSITMVGRLLPGLNRASAQARLQSLVPHLKENYQGWWLDASTLSLDRLSRVTGDADYRDDTRLTIVSLFLMCVSAAVLLIACLNLSHMAIVRGTTRHREIAVRMAIGGSRLPIVRQLLVESLLLAILGGGCGLLLAFWGARSLNIWLGALNVPVDLAGSLRIGLDVRVLAATLVFSMIACVLSGLWPALRLSRRDVIGDLKESRGEALRPAGRVRGPRGLSVLCQNALSVVLVMGASLFTRSALQTAQVSSAFDLDGKLLIELEPFAGGHNLTEGREAIETLVERLRSVGGILAVGISESFPLGVDGGRSGKIREHLPGVEEDQRDQEQVLRDALANLPAKMDTMYAVGVDYFDSLGMTLLQGRALNHLDAAPDAEKVLIIDERIARRLRADGHTLGCLVQNDWPFKSSPYRVIGIVPHVPAISDEKGDRGQAYVPIRHDRLPRHIHLRIAKTPREAEAALVQQIREVIRNAGLRLPVVTVTNLADCCRDNPSVWAAVTGARLAAIFAGMALFLASLGVYAVKGYMVASRTPEIGIRKALGATRRNVIDMVLREGMALTIGGLIVGLLAGCAVARLISSLLYGVRSVDPVSIAATVTLLGAASLLASYIPARRAAKIDPMAALRYE